MTGKKESKVEYIPPDSRKIDTLAKQVCKEMAKRHDDDYENPQVVWGLADFLKLMGRLQAKKMNSE